MGQWVPFVQLANLGGGAGRMVVSSTKNLLGEGVSKENSRLGQLGEPASCNPLS